MLPADFDAARYLSLNPDLVAAYGADTTQATNHWLNWGMAEGRNYGQTGWLGNTDPRTFWAGSDKSSIEIERLISQGYTRPETYAQYGPGSPSWIQDHGVLPTDPGWQDYINRTQASGRAEAERQAAADDDDFGILEIAALAAATYFGGAALGAWGGAGEAAAASTWTAADAAATYGTFEGVGAAAYAAPTVASVSPATWAAFGQTASTADLYAAATASAINTSVADYTAAAIMGEATGAASAFSTLPLALSGPAASGSFWSTALDSLSTVAKTGQQAASLMRLVNPITGQNTIVPKSAPVPAGYKVDTSWSPPQIAMPAATVQEAAAVNPSTASDGAGIVAASGSLVPFIAIAAALAAVLYLGKSHG